MLASDVVPCQFRGACLLTYKLFLGFHTCGMSLGFSFSKPRDLLRVHFLLPFAINKYSLCVQNHIPAMISCYGLYGARARNATDWSICAGEVCASHLRYTLRANPRLVPRIRLDFEHPHRSGDRAPLRCRNQIIFAVLGRTRWPLLH